ncbi:MAG: RNA polymerase sigma factor [Acidobacteriota bacterium]
MTASILAALLRSARRGSDEAFTRVVEATRDSLFWTVRRMVGRDAVAEEILQDAYAALWGLPETGLPSEPMAWLRRFCVNRAIDYLRREENRRPHEGGEFLEELPAAARPDVELGLREAEEVVARAMQALPPQERGAFVLKLVEGLEYPEVAALLGVSESTVRNQVMQARRKVQRYLQAAGIEL